jgi:hypothetical protein
MSLNTLGLFRVAELREMFGPLVLTGAVLDRSAIQQAQGAGVPIQEWNTPGACDASTVFGGVAGSHSAQPHAPV